MQFFPYDLNGCKNNATVCFLHPVWERPAMEGNLPALPPGDKKIMYCLRRSVYTAGIYVLNHDCLHRDAPICSSRVIRSSIGGWVLNSFRNPPPESGLTINRCAVAGVASIGIFRLKASSFRNALARY